MKIGMVINDMSSSGGHNKLALMLSIELMALGHTVVIYTQKFDPDKCHPTEIHKVKIVSLNTPETVTQNQTILSKIKKVVTSPLNTIISYRNLSNLVSNDIDVLIIHDESSLYILNYLERYFLKKIKIVWMLNHELSKKFYSFPKKIFDIFHAKSSKILLIQLLGLPGMLIEHVVLNQSIRNVQKYATYDLKNKILVKDLLGKEATIVYAGADLEKYKKLILQKKERDIKKQFNILSVGILYPYRRYEDLIDAVRSLNESGYQVKAKIVGSDKFAPEYKKELVSKIERSNLVREVVLIGEIPQNEMDILYVEADAFVFVNNGRTWGISVFEAVAAGIPIVITNNIGAVDIVKTHEIGSIVEPKNPSQISNALKNMIDHPEQSAAVAAKASLIIEDMLSWKSYTQRMLSLLKN